MSRPPIRVFTDQPLIKDGAVTLTPPQSHYLTTVMRQGRGGLVELFNGTDGAWSARVEVPNRKKCLLHLTGQVAPQEIPADVWLCLAPLKKGRIDWAVEKACELGAAQVRLVRTRRTIVDTPNPDRLKAHMIEAAEQCGRTHVPGLDPPVALPQLLRDWPAKRQLLFCDEAGDAPPLATALRTEGPWALLIGPEGGFTPEERDLLRAQVATSPISLGPHILRADTAAVAALSLFQAYYRVC